MQEISINDPKMTKTTLDNLEPDSKYQLLLRAKTSVGHGDSVELFERTLPPGPPVAPNFTWENVSNQKGAIKVIWSPSVPGFEGTRFAVEYRKLGDQKWTHQEPDSGASRTLVVKGLQTSVVYEMRVVAYSGNTQYSPETSSIVKLVRIGRKRHLEQPTFEFGLNKWKTDNIVYVYLKNYDKATVSAFYVQYKPSDANTDWLTLSDTPVSEGAEILVLKKGISYQIRVVTKSPLGNAASLHKAFPPRHEAASSSSANIQALNTATCRQTRLMFPHLLTLIVLLILRGYL